MSEGKKEYNPDGTYSVVGPSGRKILYNPDGTVCRSCNTLLDFKSANLMGATAGKAGASKKVVQKTTTQDLPTDCPADVVQLGNGTWTLLHTIAAKYPPKPSISQQKEIKSFLQILSRIYPCNFCAKDFNDYIKTNEIKAGSQDDLGKWLCDAHNEVNVKLGKPKFDCNFWKQRWKDGWEDGRCD